MSGTSESGRVLRPRASRSNLSSNGNANGSSSLPAAASTSSSRVTNSRDEAASTSQAIPAALKIDAEEVRARIQARAAVVDRVHEPAPAMQAYHRLAVAWLVLTV